MKKFCFIITLALTGVIIFPSCDKDDNDGDNEQELITTVKLIFAKSGGSDLVFTGKDLDGAGGNPPVDDEIKLEPLSQYSLSIEFLDESDAGQVKDLTEEVRAEKAAHLICFATGATISNLNITDFDNLGKPLGLESSLMTGAAGAGNFEVSLKHEPNKNAAQPCSTGETDVTVSFPIKVE